MEKIRRNTEKMSRSSERVGGGRSGSLERRRSGDESPVLNQSTVHGIASPSRRPTIFDVFRPSRKGRERDAAKSSGSSDRDNISTSSNQSGHHGPSSLVQSVKQVVQQAVAGGSGSASGGASASGSGSGGSSAHKTSASKYKDGSAHPHAGSDAQVRGQVVVWD